MTPQEVIDLTQIAHTVFSAGFVLGLLLGIPLCCFLSDVWQTYRYWSALKNRNRLEAEN